LQDLDKKFEDLKINDQIEDVEIKCTDINCLIDSVSKKIDKFLTKKKTYTKKIKVIA
jgi:hypothetical protein